MPPWSGFTEKSGKQGALVGVAVQGPLRFPPCPGDFHSARERPPPQSQIRSSFPKFRFSAMTRWALGASSGRNVLSMTGTTLRAAKRGHTRCSNSLARLIFSSSGLALSTVPWMRARFPMRSRRSISAFGPEGTPTTICLLASHVRGPTGCGPARTSSATATR